MSRVESRLFRGPRSLFGWDKVEWDCLLLLLYTAINTKTRGIAREGPGIVWTQGKTETEKEKETQDCQNPNGREESGGGGSG